MILMMFDIRYQKIMIYYPIFIQIDYLERFIDFFQPILDTKDQ